MTGLKKVRIDKWLWAVRAFKSRTLASDACNGGKVKIEGKKVKPSHLISEEDIIEFQKSGNKSIYKVTGLIEKRVSAQLAGENYEDLSPPEIKDEKMPSAFHDFPVREKGLGRPTKKERRKMNKFRGK